MRNVATLVFAFLLLVLLPERKPSPSSQPQNKQSNRHNLSIQI